MPRPKGRGSGHTLPFGYTKWDGAVDAVVVKVPATDYPLLKDKQKNGSRNNPEYKWVILSHKIWLDAGREPIDGRREVLVHLDSNPLNNNLDNLYKVPRRLMGPMNWFGRFTTDREITRAYIVLTELEVELKKKIKATRRRKTRHLNRIGKVRTDRIGRVGDNDTACGNIVGYG